MLVFANEYKTALNMMTGDKENNLRAYEMSAREWELAGQLEEVLKVRLLIALQIASLGVTAFIC
jgi:hypothetical protein